VAGGLGALIVLALLIPFGWRAAALSGWDLGAAIYLVITWVIIGRANALQTEQMAMREDETRSAAAVLLLGSSVASLFAVGFTLGAAGEEHGGHRLWLIVGALATVMVSWAVVNTVFTLKYADLHYHAATGPSSAAIDFGAPPDDQPDYRDFAYLAFTIGMCYQVSDTTLRNRTVRRTALVHSGLSYLFGVVIIAASINLVAGLIQ
jgi:uncharacterized membrane protein